MTIISGALIGPLRSGAFRNGVRRVATIARRLAVPWQRRAAVKLLRQLDDRELRDIGLLRSQIDQAVRGVANPDLARL
jgi:uncharacterized protein YjiS (DUF1127 family)